MILSGSKISGYTYLGKPVLSSIGNQIFHWDYRRAVELVSTDRIKSLGDLGINAFNLVGNSSTRPVMNTDGVGTSGNTTQLQGIVKAPLKKLHDGSAHFIFAVLRYNNGGNVGASGTYIIETGLNGVAPGFNLAISASGNQMTHFFRNDAGSNLGTHSSGSNTLPEDSTFRLITFTLYGPTGANNSRITIANNSYLATRNYSFGSNDAGRISAFRFGVSDITRIKTIGAYDLSGKTPTQIDDFVQTFNAVLKQDSEYASLTTI